MSDSNDARHWKKDSDAHDARRREAQATYSKASAVERQAAAESERRANIRENIVNSILCSGGVDCGIASTQDTETLVKAVVRAIALGRIPCVKIEY